MSGKKKYSYEFKLALLEEYLEGKNGGIKTIAKKYGVPYSHFRRWVYTYEANGIEGLTKVTRTYDGATKIHIVEYMHTNSLSVNQATAIAEVQRLRMENEYLKKLNALIQGREKSEQKKK